MSMRKMLCTLGMFDIPIIQMQPPFVVDLLDSNIALFGATMSGKTTFIKNLVNILHKQYNEKQEQIFILDFGGALFECGLLPLVSAYFDNSNEEYVKRVFKILDAILKENIDKLSGKNYRDAELDLIHTTFIIDNINAFEDEPRYAAYQDKLAKLCREGISKGITIVFTASETKGIGKYLGNFKQKIAFEMPQDKYLDIFSGKTGVISNNPGHGFANVTVKPEGITGTFRMNLPYEIQCALPYKPEKEAEEENINRIKEKFGYFDNGYRREVKKYRTFPKELTRYEFDILKSQSDEIVSENMINVGLDYVDFNPVGVDLHKSHVIGIYGKKEFGKSNLLNLLVKGTIQNSNNARFVFFDDGRRQLEPIYNEIKNKVEAVMINDYREVELRLNEEEPRTKKLSPLQQFYVYLNENYVSLDKRFLAGIYGVSKELSREFNKIPDCAPEIPDFTVFIIQSKLVYLNALENKYFINNVLPQLVAIAEEFGFCFIFSDIQKITDVEQSSFLNNVLSATFLLDNIAEFATERGQRTIFGNMDSKSLKEDYAKCELGDGYFYDVEADILKKLKFIKA